MDPGSLRNFKDFLQLYNHITEKCFYHCVDTFTSRSLEADEIQCVERCQNKFIRFNHRLMENFVKTQSIVMNKRIQEMEAQAAEAQKQQEQSSSVDLLVSSEENEALQQNSTKENAVLSAS